MSAARVVVLSCGNASRGDDAIGPTLHERLDAWYSKHREALADRLELTLVHDFQLQIEHALELEHQDLALFIDAAASGPAPYALSPVAPEAAPTYTTHALPPAEVLAVFAKITGRAPPPAFVLAVRGASFELGEGLSPAAKGHVEAAWTRVTLLLARPVIDAWSSHAVRPGSEVRGPLIGSQRGDDP